MRWNPDPVIFSIGPLALRYYSLMFVLGFFTMGPYVSNIFKANGKNPDHVSTLTTYIIVAMMIGARLAHCLFYEPQYYFQHPVEILYVWQGGLASHGGYVGVFLAVILFLKSHRDIHFFWLMDAIAAPCLFVGGLIRIGNFMNSEIYGGATNVPWAIIFEKVDNIPRHPSQLYESVSYFAIAAVLFLSFKMKSKVWNPGTNMILAIILSFSFRFLIEFTKEEQSSLLSGTSINMGQWLSLASVIIGFGLLHFLPKRNLERTIIKNS